MTAWRIIIVPYLDLEANSPADHHPYLARDCAAYGQNSFYRRIAGPI
jgi:hypothetical protein